MTTMTLPAPTVKATRTTRKPCSCRLTLSIGDNDYRVRPIDPGFAGIKAYRLRKIDSDQVYDVVQGVDELRCDCADYEFRHEGNGTHCKHIRSMVACGLLSAPDAKGGHETPTLGTAEGEADADCPKGTHQASTPEPASKVEIVPPCYSAPATVDALDWAHAICGKLWDVAEPAQRTFAVAIMNCDSGMYFQRRITPGGPSLEDLRARLAEKGVGSTDTIAEGVISTDTPEDVRSTDTPAHDRMSDGEPVENISQVPPAPGHISNGELLAKKPEVVPAPCCPAAEPVPCKACAADGWPENDEIDRFTWTISGGLTGDPEPASDEELEDFDPDNLTFREIPDSPDSDDVPPDDEHPSDSDSDSAPRLSVAEWIRREADRYTALGTDAADLIAETLHSLARGFDRVSANTVEQYRDRWAAIEAPGALG